MKKCYALVKSIRSMQLSSNPVGCQVVAQWYFRITAYVDELRAGLEALDGLEHIMSTQRNWIGRGKGVEFEMAVEGADAHFRF